jgi:BirA family transcriptional regulator, biotin operon repressor / biotin---[acetyl-CoA-carboxylase] ligase
VDALILRSALADSRFADVRVVDSIDSTNRAMTAWGSAGLSDDGSVIGDGAVLIARSQTAGRGRLGRRWIAPVDSALLMSVLVVPGELAMDRWPLLSFAMGLAVVDAAQCGAALKWPNDVIVADPSAANGYRKLAGILAESSVGATRSHVVVGVGVNLFRPREVPHLGADAVPTWLSEHRSVDGDGFTADVLRFFDSYVQILLADPQRFLETYRAACVTISQRVTADFGDHKIIGTATEVDSGGRLVIVDDANQGHVLSAGDVQHVRPTQED